MGSKEFFPGKQPYGFARNGATRRGRARGPRSARDHGGAKNTGPVEKRRPITGRG